MNNNHTDASCYGEIVSDAPEPWFGSYFVSTYPPFSQWSPDDVPHVERVLAKKTEAPDVPLGLYVHIPFCAKRCDYCYYLSYADKTKNQHRDYVDALLNELALYRRAPAMAERRLSFVYFGGGTPSLLDEASLQSLMQGIQRLFTWDSVEEVTFECAPQSVTESKLRVLHNAGVTRLSLGVQTLDDDVLRLNGRVHSRKDVDQAYERIRRVGFDAVNLDLIVGLPGESDDSVLQSLERVIEMSPESVTIYQLEIPQNTPLFRVTRDGDPPAAIPSWHMKRFRLARCFERLESAGFTIRSAYAAVHDPDRHRFVYQDEQYRGADLLGIGVSSFSYLTGVHYQNKADYDAYIESVGQRAFPVGRAHRLRSSERLVREFVLQLKLGRADFAYFEKKFGTKILERFKKPLKQFADRGWLAIDATGVRVTREGLVRIDRLLPAFYLSRHRSVRYS
ncbi:MAG: coproporphyrinogen-III oxidase family protein [Chloroflexota bacterium]